MKAPKTFEQWLDNYCHRYKIMAEKYPDDKILQALYTLVLIIKLFYEEFKKRNKLSNNNK